MFLPLPFSGTISKSCYVYCLFFFSFPIESPVVYPYPNIAPSLDHGLSFPSLWTMVWAISHFPKENAEFGVVWVLVWVYGKPWSKLFCSASLDKPEVRQGPKWFPQKGTHDQGDFWKCFFETLGVVFAPPSGETFRAILSLI